MAIGTPTQRRTLNVTTTTATTFSPTTTVVAGTVGFVFCTTGAGVTLTSVTDSVGNTWAVDVVGGDASRKVGIASAQIATQITTGDTITLNWSGASLTEKLVWVQEVTGLATSSVFDVSATGSSTGTAFSVGPTSALSQADEIVWAVGRQASGTTWTKGASYADPTTPSQGSISVLEYKIVAATTAVTADGTFGASAAWAGAVATYKGLVVAGTADPYPYVDGGYYPTQG